MSKSRKQVNKVTKQKKRPIKVVYPYMCPFCDELAYPVSEREFKPLRLSGETISFYKCMAEHTFYVHEKVVKDQSWADDKINDPKMQKRSKEWKRQLRQHKYGVDDLEE